MNTRTDVKMFLSVFVILTLLMGGFTACDSDKSSNNADESGKIKVAVAILPLKNFVEKIGGDKVEVTVAIPKGASPANYEPSPKEIKSIVDSEIYFSLAMPTEKGNILPKLTDERMNIIALNKLVDEKYPPRMFDSDHDEDEREEAEIEEHGHSHEGRDPHIWTSAKRSAYMLTIMAEELAKISPENKELFEKNAKDFEDEILALDKEITDAFKDKSCAFIVFHPSLGYFADDYGLEMISIESDGKKTGAKQLKEVIDLARQKDIKTVLYQHEFYNQSAKQIAGELGGEAKGYTVLWEDYLLGLRELKDILSEK